MEPFDWYPLSEIQRRDPRRQSRWGFAWRRLVAAGVTLLGVSLVGFVLLRLAAETG